MNTINKTLICFLLSTIPCVSQASMSLPDLSHPQLTVAGGFLQSNTNDTHLVISPYETDSLKVHGGSNSAVLWQLGVGYSLFAEQLRQRTFFNNLLVEFNIYGSGDTTIKGDVWQYQLPQFNNYSFHASAHSTRFMLDVKPQFSVSKTIELYPIVGLGVSDDAISYSETVTGVGVDPNSALSLGRHSSANFAYDLGVGVSMDINAHLGASLEYLYMGEGSVTSSGTPSNSVALQSPPSFNVTNQALLFGLSWKI